MSAQVRTALQRYKVTAVVVGVGLLILCLELVLHYGFDNEALAWWSPIHGVLYMLYLVAGAEQVSAGQGSAKQPSSTPPQPERAQPPALVPQGISWRNAAYSAQWWAFAAFALLLWWKMVRQDQLDRSTGRSDVDEKVAVR